MELEPCERQTTEYLLIDTGIKKMKWTLAHVRCHEGPKITNGWKCLKLLDHKKPMVKNQCGCWRRLGINGCPFWQEDAHEARRPLPLSNFVHFGLTPSPLASDIFYGRLLIIKNFPDQKIKMAKFFHFEHFALEIEKKNSFLALNVVLDIGCH